MITYVTYRSETTGDETTTKFLATEKDDDKTTLEIWPTDKKSTAQGIYRQVSDCISSIKWQFNFLSDVFLFIIRFC